MEVKGRRIILLDKYRFPVETRWSNAANKRKREDQEKYELALQHQVKPIQNLRTVTAKERNQKRTKNRKKYMLKT